ncbi:serine hydrolase domain-containing protein [Micromonospora musae]|uniref:serine hydrolase domain-containing protein n=1 Tax=Micromonospora musae TaxID=1894970 RepID=UPI0033D5E7B4
MADVDFSQDWITLLGRLDRQVSSGRPSPDTAALSEMMSSYQVPGVSIAVGHMDGRIWATGYGVTGGETSTPVTTDTAFAACSVSKHVAAFGALLLVQNGVLDLDTDIDEYLTSWHLRDRAGRRPAVTVRQLLAHTAGLSDTWYRGYPAGHAPSLRQVLDGSGATTTPPVRSTLLPGSRFRYSGSHYSVLQQLMVDATGTPFEELMRALVLEPVAMVDSSFDQHFPHQRPPQLVARGHHGGGTAIPGGWREQPETAAAGLWSTPTDLLRLDVEIARAASGDSKLLDRDLATEMWTPQIPGGSYGLGTEVDDRAGRRRFGHTGQNVGYTCFSYVWPDSRIAVAAMTNSEDGWELLASLRAAADRRYTTGIAAAPIADVAGRYLLRDDYPIDITVTDGQLTFSAPAQQPVLLLAGPDGRYLHPGLDLEVRFLQANDQPCILELRQEGVTQTARPSTLPDQFSQRQQG